MDDLFTLHGLSLLYNCMIEGYEDNHEENIKAMKHVYSDFEMDETELKQFLSCNLDLKNRDIEELWDAVFKWDIYEKDKIKNYLVEYICEKKNFKLDIKGYKTSTRALLKNTCINEEKICCNPAKAAILNHFECFKYLHENEKSKFANKNSNVICLNILRGGGSLKFLKYAVQNGYKMDKNYTCQIVVKYNNLECLKYVLKNRCVCNNKSFLNAAYFGNLECLKYIHKNNLIEQKNENIEWDDVIDDENKTDNNETNDSNIETDDNETDICDANLDNSIQDAYEWDDILYDEKVNKSKNNNNELECLKFDLSDSSKSSNSSEGSDSGTNYLTDHGSNYPDYDKYCMYCIENYSDSFRSCMCNLAVSRGNLECLKFLHENGYTFDKYICYHVTDSSNFECLKYVYEHIDNKNTQYGYFDEVIKSDLNADAKSINICERAAFNGNIECLIYLYEKGFPLGKNTCVSAVKGGNFECLKYAHENGCPLKKEECEKEVEESRNLNLECLKYLRENGCSLNNEKICKNAIRENNLEVLKYIHENGFSWDEDICDSIFDIDCFKYVFDHMSGKSTGCPNPKCRSHKNLDADDEININEWKKTICKHASYNIELLKYAHKNGCPWDEKTCSQAAYYQELKCLKYAHENGCPWDENTCSSAAYYGSLECLEYAHKNGCPWNEKTCENAVYNSSMDLVYAGDYDGWYSVKKKSKKNLECLKYAHKNGCPWDEKACSQAAYYQELKCLKYARENGCPWDKETCYNGLHWRNNDCFEYAFEKGCPYDKVECLGHAYHEEAKKMLESS
jgi:hypothetical protein